MNALGRKAIEVRLVAELRELPADAKPNLREIRLAIAAELGGCSPAELAGAIQALRYQGKLAWDSLELSPSMIDTSGSSKVPEAEGGVGVTAAPPSNADAAGSAELGVEDGTAGGRAGTPAVPSSDVAAGPDDDEDYPGELNDVAEGAPTATPATGPIPSPAVSVEGAGFVPRKSLRQAGIHAASTRAGARPLPVPAHEPEVAREVREEAEELRARRHRAGSTGTVRVPLELRKLGIPDLGLGESIASLLAEQPHDLMVAINRKHPQTWRRVLLLARAAGQRPAQALYAALEAGLDQLETETEESHVAGR